MAILLLGVFCLLKVLAASEQFHEFFHADAKVPAHQCAVTLLAKGQLDSATPSLALPVPQATSSPVLICFSPLLAAVDYLLLPERAPPAFS